MHVWGQREVVAMLPNLLLQRFEKARARLAGLLVEILRSQIDGVDRVVVVILQLVDSGCVFFATLLQREDGSDLGLLDGRIDIFILTVVIQHVNHDLGALDEDVCIYALSRFALSLRDEGLDYGL